MAYIMSKLKIRLSVRSGGYIIKVGMVRKLLNTKISRNFMIFTCGLVVFDIFTTRPSTLNW